MIHSPAPPAWQPGSQSPGTLSTITLRRRCPQVGGRPGGQWAAHRRVVNGILWKLATGVPWRDLPERYRPWQTCYEWFRRWQADGTWQRLLAHAQTHSDAVEEVDWEVVVDATILRAHQHAAGAQKGDPGPT